MKKVKRKKQEIEGKVMKNLIGKRKGKEDDCFFLLVETKENDTKINNFQ